MVVTFIFQRPLICLPPIHALDRLKSVPLLVVLILFVKKRFPKALALKSPSALREQADVAARDRLLTQGALSVRYERRV
jgi:hypothetical protein